MWFRRGAIVDAPEVQRPPGEANEAGLQPCHAVARGDLVEHLWLHRYGRGNVEQNAIVLEARHAGGRQVTGAAQGRVLNDRAATAAARPATWRNTRQLDLRRRYPIRGIGS